MNPTTSKQRIIAQQLEDHQYRLVSLQASLQEAFRGGMIDAGQYQKRSKFISEELQLLRDLSSWAAAEDMALTQEANLGLPSLNHCTPEEKKICYEFLRLRHLSLEKLIQTASRILDWVERASSNRSNVFAQIFQLSKLKKKIEEVEGLIAISGAEDTEADKLVIKLGYNLSHGKSGSDLKQNLEYIMKLFNDLDAVSARIAQLKSQVRNEEHQLGEMRNWLDCETQLAVAPLNFSAPPSPEDTQRAETIRAPAERTYLEQTKRRLELAENYIHTCARQDNPAWKNSNSINSAVQSFRQLKDHREYPRRGGEITRLPGLSQLKG